MLGIREKILNSGYVGDCTIPAVLAGYGSLG